MNVDDLSIFRTVAQRGSIAAAARLLECDPSAVSRTIAGLERRLGLRLFQRTTRRMDLTEAGERYLRRIEPVLEELLAAQDEALGLTATPRGRLRITASNAFGQTILVPLIRPFREAFPEIEIDLLLTDALLDLVREQVDIAIRLGPRPSGDLIISKLRNVTMRLVASPTCVAKIGDLRSPHDIADRPCLVAANQARGRWHFSRAEERISVDVRAAISTSNTLAIRQFSRDGLGLAVLPDWLVQDDLDAGDLMEALPGWEVRTGNFDPAIWTVYPSRSFLPSKTRSFIDFLARNLRRGAIAE